MEISTILAHVNPSEQADKDTKNLNARIPASLDKRLEREAVESEMSKQAIVIVALENYLQTVEAVR